MAIHHVRGYLKWTPHHVSHKPAVPFQYRFGIEFLSPRTNRPKSVTVRFFFAAYTNIPPSPLKTLLALLASFLRIFTHCVSILRQQDMRNAEVRLTNFDNHHSPPMNNNQQHRRRFFAPAPRKNPNKKRTPPKSDALMP